MNKDDNIDSFLTQQKPQTALPATDNLTASSFVKKPKKKPSIHNSVQSMGRNEFSTEGDTKIKEKQSVMKPTRAPNDHTSPATPTRN